LFFSNVPAMIGYWDKDLYNRFANRAYWDWFGVEPSMLPGRHISGLLGEAIYARNRPYIEAVLRGEPQVFERSYPRPDGSGVRHSLAHYLPDVNEGKVRGFYVMVLDISAQRAAEAEINAGELRYRTALESAEMGTWTYAAETGLMHLDARTRKHFGAAAGTLAEAEFEARVHPDDRRRIERELADMAAQAGPRPENLRVEVRMLSASGEVRHVELSVQLRRHGESPDQRPVGLSGTSRDVTGRREAEEALRRSESLLRTISENLPDGAIYQAHDFADGTTQFNFMGDGVEKLSGVSAVEAMADPAALFARVHPEDLPSVLQAVERTRLTGEMLVAEARAIHRDGSIRWIGLHSSPRIQPDGSVINDGVMLDISARKQAELELREAKEAAEQATRAKADFIANITHELRTPMNAILGFTQLLEGRSMGDEELRLVKKIRAAGRSLLGVINDVLDFSKIDAGRMEIEHIPFALSELLERVDAILAASVGDKPLSLSVGAPPEGCDSLIGDPLRLEQVLINLGGNAVKFTERGSVSIEVARRDAPAGRIGLRFTVCDTGIGIAPEHLQVIFTAFSQADTSTTRRFGGTGLGLGISRRLVDLMGGDMGVTSEFGQGSTFWFEIPFEPAPGEVPEHADSPTPAAAMPSGCGGKARLAGLHILVVDDNEINREVAQCILEEEGATVGLAEHGLAAVEFLRQRPRHVDAVLMDVQMPVMDGYAATRQIRSSLGLADLPIIALTAGAFDSQREAALAAGMNEFVAKPFETEDMIALLVKALRADAAA
jgi:PAS domain S-box-containing protein